MHTFVSLEHDITQLLQIIIQHPYAHGLWLNTLSYLENCGARKIAACEHPTLVHEEMLKHAAEEFRHAFYLKKQLARIHQHFEDYRLSYMLGGWTAYHYLNSLDLYICRYLKSLGFAHSHIKSLAYLLVTYTIELRASELYPLYHMILQQCRSPVHVQSILLEEKGHLRDMERLLNKVPESSSYVAHCCQVEAALCRQWIVACYNSVSEMRL